MVQHRTINETVQHICCTFQFPYTICLLFHPLLFIFLFLLFSTPGSHVSQWKFTDQVWKLHMCILMLDGLKLLITSLVCPVLETLPKHVIYEDKPALHPNTNRIQSSYTTFVLSYPPVQTVKQIAKICACIYSFQSASCKQILNTGRIKKLYMRCRMEYEYDRFQNMSDKTFESRIEQ